MAQESVRTTAAAQPVQSFEAHDKVPAVMSPGARWMVIALGAGIVIFWLAFLYISLSGTLSFTPELIAKTFALTGNPADSELARRGQLGDSFGVFNALISALALLGLISTALLQRSIYLEQWQQTKVQIAILQRQNFQAQLASAVHAYDSLLESLELTSANGASVQTFRGRRALRELWNDRLLAALAASTTNSQLSRTARSFTAAKRQSLANDMPSSVAASEEIGELMAEVAVWSPGDCFAELRWAWNRLYVQEQYQLDALFRAWYHVYRTIDGAGKYGLNGADRWIVASTFRAKLSWIELVFLLMNQADLGEGPVFPKACRISNCYAVFDNLAIKSDPIVALVVHSVGHGGNESLSQLAFSSHAARTALLGVDPE